MSEFSNLTSGNETVAYVPYDNLTITTVVFMSIACAMTLCFNIPVVIAFIRDARIRTPFNLFILHLTLTDLSIALFVMPVTIKNTLSPPWNHDYRLCTWLLLNGWVCCGAGTTSVMLISLDRLWSLAMPMHYRNHRSKTLTIAICISMWIYLFVLQLPFSLFDENYRDLRFCRADFQAQGQYATALEVMFFLGPLIVVVGCYVAIIYMLTKRRQTVKPLTIQDATSQRNGEIEKQERRLLAALIWIAACMILFWGPATIFFIMASYLDGIYSVTAAAAVTCLEYFNCMINPFIYHYSLPDIHRAVNNLFRRRKI